MGGGTRGAGGLGGPASATSAVGGGGNPGVSSTMTVSPQRRFHNSCLLSPMKLMAARAVSAEIAPSGPGSNPRRSRVAT